ncbi:threonylcarbamoyl-AMP synthase [bacterium]|nr:threonylcarbamoyl-AMP synthase [bacterium]
MCRPDMDISIKDALAVLRQGGIIAYPTETVYGLGGDPSVADVTEKIAHLKGRLQTKNFLALVPSSKWIYQLAEPVCSLAERLIEHFWPGPLTLVLPASSKCPASLISDDHMVGLRHSPDPICQILLDEFQKPLISTSANRAGDAPACSAEEVEAYFGSNLACVLDGGSRINGIPSTIVKVIDNEYYVLREGAIPVDLIEAVKRNDS